MRAVVRAAFIPFTEPLEGSVPYLYQDVLGLVTIAHGVLVDPASLALTLPLRRPDGSLATRDEIAAEWHRVKNDPLAAKQGHLRARAITTLRLDAAGIAEVTGRKLDDTWAKLVARFPAIESWPADAQLATLSMAWACGPAFRFPKLAAALRAQDWETAALECAIRPEHGTIRARNAAVRTMYRNAMLMQGAHLDEERLYWPTSISDETPTEPELPSVETMPGIDGGVVHPPMEFEPQQLSMPETGPLKPYGFWARLVAGLRRR